ncbi:ankyrin repeat and KH domain-containing protein mask-like [Haliotis rubra]|uniref:ankyrin repeat and KH domain-containing protein mask-like n=1 Tax=Haliotis rubra TaxID=36100 RepID=UPI001EE58F58|nr:ankyrin repeat and KH domain-containing protein mask-like [Haliotis rubra]
MSEEDFASELADEGVSAVKRFTIKKEGIIVKTNTYLLTFDRSSLPKSIKAGYFNIGVDLYVPSPLRCYECQHLARNPVETPQSAIVVVIDMMVLTVSKNISAPTVMVPILPHQAPSLCFVYNASTSGDLSKVKFALSQEQVDIDCKDRIGRTPLMWAAGKGHRDVVELFVKRGANLLLTDRSRSNILHYACAGGHVEVTKYILSQNTVDINSRRNDNRTPVMIAGRWGHRDVVELLVDHRANLSLRDVHGYNILHLGSHGEYVEVLKYVLSQDTEDINSRANDNKTPVMVAGRRGHKDVVELFVKRGANLSLTDRSRSNILHYACAGGHVEVTKYILSQNTVDINSRRNDNRTPVMIAGRWGHRDVVELLVDHRANLSLRDVHGYNILHLGSHGEYVEVLKYVLSQDTEDINSRANDNKTPVMVAGRRGHRDVVELFVKRGANLSLTDRSRSNILHYACAGGHVEVTKYILSQNTVDINSRRNDNRTPVMIAGRWGHRDVVELLVDHRANLSLRDVHGYNILHLGSHGEYVEVLKYVLSQDTEDINSRANDNKTPVMVAGERGHRDVVELFVKRGANLSLTDRSRSNILHYACAGGHVEVTKYILSQNTVDINSRRNDNRTPVMIAGRWGHRDVVELLVDHRANLSLRDVHGYNILHLGSHGEYVEVLKYVLSQDTEDINSRANDNKTPVMVAGRRGHKDVVELFVKRGANLSLTDRSKSNILHYACAGGHVEVTKYILSQNTVDINSRRNDNRTPVMIAGRWGHRDVVELLVDHRANLSLRDVHGYNILHLGSHGEHVEVLKYVLSQDTEDINSRANDNKTPVMVAGRRGHKDVVELLVKKGANLTLRDARSDNILHLACRGGHVGVVEYVLSQGIVDVNAKNEKRESAASIAKTLGLRHVLELLVSHGANM